MDGQPFLYRHSGLHVASAIELPEWRSFACVDGEVDVRIVLSDEVGRSAPEDGAMDVANGRLRFAIDGIGGWEIEQGRTIRLFPGLTAAPRELRLFTLGSAWGAIGYQRGLAMWHGSAVARAGRAVLFAGAQEAGKSTMAAAMLARGAELVGDDLSRVDPVAGGAHIWRSSSRSKLWRSAIEHLGWQNRAGERDYFRDDKYHCDPPVLYEAEATGLAAIVILAEGQEVSLARVPGAKGLTAALRATLYRPEFVDSVGAWPQQGALAARIVSHVPVWCLTRPLDFARLDEACDAVERLFQL